MLSTKAVHRYPADCYRIATDFHWIGVCFHELHIFLMDHHRNNFISVGWISTELQWISQFSHGFSVDFYIIGIDTSKVLHEVQQNCNEFHRFSNDFIELPYTSVGVGEVGSQTAFLVARSFGHHTWDIGLWRRGDQSSKVGAHLHVFYFSQQITRL